MKKILSLIVTASLAGMTSVWAQDTQTTTTTTTTESGSAVVLKSKKGVNILPEAGEWALGISANPFLEYIGNFANGNSFNNTPTVGNASGPDNNVLGGDYSGNAVFAKKMVDAHTAYRARFQFNFNSLSNKVPVAKSTLTFDPLNPQFAEDKITTGTSAVLLGLGLEKRRGASRVQGVYGAEALIGYYKSTVKYDYGNAIDVNFNTPASFAGAYNGNARIIEDKNGSRLFLGVRGFGGVEYFVAPKLSLGGEIGYTVGFSTATTGKVKYEQWDSSTSSVKEFEIKDTSSGIHGFGIGLDNLNASINAFFYF